MPTLVEAEVVARWKNGSDGDLILNQDGRLWERNTLSHRYRIVRHGATGMEALLYAAQKGYDLVGTVVPKDFVPPEKEEEMSATETRRTRGPAGTAQAYYDRIKELLESGEVSTVNEAAEKVAEEVDRKAASVLTSYYRIARQKGDTQPRARRSSNAPRSAPRVIGVPEELENLLPMVRAGIHAFERIIEWAELRDQQLKEREATLDDREKQAMEAIQARLEELFPGAKK